MASPFLLLFAAPQLSLVAQYFNLDFTRVSRKPNWAKY
jgi:hypothetical protein